MKTYKIELTEEEHRFIEKKLDEMASWNMKWQSEMLMDGQFRAGGNKSLTEEKNKEIKQSFWSNYAESIRFQKLVNGLRNKLESGYEKTKANKKGKEDEL